MAKKFFMQNTRGRFFCVVDLLARGLAYVMKVEKVNATHDTKNFLVVEVLDELFCPHCEPGRTRYRGLPLM